jgi:hypothetical protein
MKVVVLASAGVFGSAWALVRHYTHPPPPMVVTMPVRHLPVEARDGGGGPIYEITGTEPVP